MREKYLDLLRAALPGIQSIGVLWNSGNPIHNQSLGQVAEFAQSAKVSLHPVAVSQPGELDAAFAELASARVQALAVFQDGMFLTNGSRIIALAARHRIPTLYGVTELVRDGGLMGYGVNLPDMYRQGAAYVDRILDGATPAELPIQQPTKFELVVNLKTARTLKLTLPPAFLARADTVIS
jgi:putative ABC transport system substrate-binding protein